ncbi:MAG: amidohydrolase [Kiritimatiellaeota bacterium]|nr:amidohydrolase [Kiritimatiellota bacterium]
MTDPTSNPNHSGAYCMVIDFHTHVPTDRRRWTEFIRDCRRNGVAAAATSSLGVDGWPAVPSAAHVRAANRQAREFAEFAQGRLPVFWFVYLNPCLPDCLDEAQRALDAGAVGIKLWISLKTPDGRTAPCDPVLRLAAERECPVLIHTFHRTGGNQPGELSVDQFADLARRFPTVPMIAAHAGGNWRMALGALADIPNAHVDICGCFPECGMATALVRDLGAERVVFGSDMLGRSQASQLAKVEFADLAPAEKAAVLGGNAHRLLKLAASGVLPAAPPLSVAAPEPGLPLPDSTEDHFCFCGTWPFAPDLSRSFAELRNALGSSGIRRAYTASLDAIWASDPRVANRAFFAEARDEARVQPLGVVNPRVPNWRRAVCELRNVCHGVWVSPYLHNWRLDAADHAEFFAVCAEQGLPVWINCALGDHRFRQSGVGWRPIAVEELRAFAGCAPPNEYVFQGLLANEIRQARRGVPGRTGIQFRFELSRLTDRSGDLAAIQTEIGMDALVFGAEYPLRDIRSVRWTARRLPANGTRMVEGKE